MNTAYKWGIVAIAIVLAIYGLGPTLADYFTDGQLDRNLVSAEREAELKQQGKEVEVEGDGFAKWVFDQGTPLTLGLDLQGGLLLQYKVLVDKAVQDKLDRMARDMEARISEDHPDVDIEAKHPEGKYFVRLIFDFEGATVETESGETRPKDVSDVLTQDYMSYFPNLNRIDEGGNKVRLQMGDDYIDETKKFAVKQAIETIRQRVNALGVKEPSITRRGQTDIVVQLPGLGENDRERAKELIGQTARLVFRLVDDEGTNQFFNQFQGNLPKGFKLMQVGNFRTIAYKDKDKLEEFFADRVDDNHTIGYEYVPIYENPQRREIIDKEESYWKSYYIFKETKLTGDCIQSARVSVDQQTQKPVVSLTFDRQGAQEFGSLTRENVDQRFAIMLDDEVKSAPVINEPIPGGRAQITLGSLRSYSELQQEAQDLVIVLRHGALPAPIELQYQTVVGPTLGQESITSSMWALFIGTLLIIIFMMIYYRVSGIISVTALLFNFLFILAGLAGLGATLTLPGIAGIILTVGMAVDANVIIFERIREEQRDGANAKDSVDTGFDKGFSAVADANVTTGIAALVLMQYGTGPIRGFAVTLLIGIGGTLFTAVFLSRLIFNLWLDWRSETEEVSI
jgi:preprotein translocase subunit SecD